MQQAIVDGIAQISGVETASFAQSVPMDNRTDHDPIFVEDAINADRQMTTIRSFNFVAPEFFRSVGIRLVAGRDLTWTDVYDRRPVALVSENLASELWGNPRAAVGKRIRENSNSPWREVIGIVGDVRDEGIHRPAPTMVYWPTMLREFHGQALVKRSVAFAVRTDRTDTDRSDGGHPEGRLGREPTCATGGRAIAGRRLPVGLMARVSFALVMLAIAGATAASPAGLWAWTRRDVLRRCRRTQARRNRDQAGARCTTGPS